MRQAGLGSLAAENNEALRFLPCSPDTQCCCAFQLRLRCLAGCARARHVSCMKLHPAGQTVTHVYDRRCTSSKLSSFWFSIVW